MDIVLDRKGMSQLLVLRKQSPLTSGHFHVEKGVTTRQKGHGCMQMSAKTRNVVGLLLLACNMEREVQGWAIEVERQTELVLTFLDFLSLLACT